MRIKIREAIAGHGDERYKLDDHSYRPGEVVEIDDTLAQAWLDSGVAVLPEQEPPAEEPPAEESHHSVHHSKKPVKSAK
jgi:hypothetical protein